MFRMFGTALAVCLAAPLPAGQDKLTNAIPDAGQQIAFLNHIYAIVDDETAEAIRTSAFLREFSSLDVTTVTANDGQRWTGRYMRGRETYAEFFASDDLQPPNPTVVGAVGIALSGDTAGAIDTVERRLKESAIPTQANVRRRRYGEKEVDWFKYLDISDGQPGESALSIYAMEYLPGFFAVPEANKEAAETPADTISRERYIDDGYRDRLMRDITAIEVAVRREDFRRMEPMLRAAGFRLSEGSAGAAADGADVDVEFLFVMPDVIGLRRIDFALNRPVREMRSEVIGKSRLILGPGSQARWIFAREGGLNR